MSWNYTPEESTYENVKPGEYLCVVTGAEEAMTKESHKRMLVISTRINGSNLVVKNYIVEGEYFNRNLTAFFDAFGIERGDFNYIGWVGALGAVKLVEDEKGYLKVKRYLLPEQAKDLAPWEGELPERQTVTKVVENEEDELPF